MVFIFVKVDKCPIYMGTDRLVEAQIHEFKVNPVNTKCTTGVNLHPCTDDFVDLSEFSVNVMTTARTYHLTLYSIQP